MTNNHTDIELQKDVLEDLKWDRIDPHTQREDAERAIRNLAGVRGVVNDLTGRGTKRPDDQTAPAAGHI